MTADVDLKFTAAVGNITIDNYDPMRIVGQWPEISVPVSSLVPGFHLRQAGTDAAHVRLLADAAYSIRLPAILVQKNGYRIIDGMHRLEAAKLRGEQTINARVIDCSDAEALILAVKSNTLHGLPLSRPDRISSAKSILAAHSDWSDRALARITGLSARTIASIRNSSATDARSRGKRLGGDGKRHPVVATEGRQRVAEYINAHPGATIRQIARETDVSVGTVHDVREKIRNGTAYGVKEPQRPQEQVSGISTGAAADTPPPARILHTRGRNGIAQQLCWSVMSAKLAGDPALRYTEGGREFLRWMAAHCRQADEWREFIDAIPQHWVRDVSEMAAAMSEEWRQFSERLRFRQDTAS